MTAIDQWLAGLGKGGGLAIALFIALLLGLRHATDPDHLTAVSTLTLSEDGRGARRAGSLGLCWGLGHATTLLLAGLPALLLRGYLPAAVREFFELLVGIVIIALAIRLLVRWRRGYFHLHAHRHGSRWHTHPHAHEGRAHRQEHEHRHAEDLGRSPLAAYGIGLVHGIGGSAAVTLLLISAVPQHLEAAIALVVFALATAVSMSLLSAAFGAALAARMLSRRLESAVPLLGGFSLAFGVFYAIAALAAP